MVTASMKYEQGSADDRKHEKRVGSRAQEKEMGRRKTCHANLEEEHWDGTIIKKEYHRQPSDAPWVSLLVNSSHLAGSC